jgi:hypothetical protein
MLPHQQQFAHRDGCVPCVCHVISKWLVGVCIYNRKGVSSLLRRRKKTLLLLFVCFANSNTRPRASFLRLFAHLNVYTSLFSHSALLHALNGRVPAARTLFICSQSNDVSFSGSGKNMYTGMQSAFGEKHRVYSVVLGGSIRVIVLVLSIMMANVAAIFVHLPVQHNMEELKEGIAWSNFPEVLCGRLSSVPFV